MSRTRTLNDRASKVALARRLTAIGLMLFLLSAAPTWAGCMCDEARSGRGGWCTKHAVGYVAGVRTTSEILFEALDAHGHDLDPRTTRCTACIRARKDDGYCEKHHIGFVNDLAYMSRLTYLLARGRIDAPERLTCPTCRLHARTEGWCDTCKVGRIGPIALDDREEFEALVQEVELLRQANATVERCELCAAAMLVDGRCPACKKTYRAGKVVRTEPENFGK